MAGTTLLEILIAMVIIGIITSGLMTAFAFSRRLSHRSGSELSVTGYVQEVAEQLRGAVQGNLANGLTLTPGIYVDNNMQNPPAGATRLAALNLPAEFPARFLSSPGVSGGTVALANHGDGRVVVVEALVDLDGDGLTGIDLGGGQILRRVRVRVKWTTPTT